MSIGFNEILVSKLNSVVTELRSDKIKTTSYMAFEQFIKWKSVNVY